MDSYKKDWFTETGVLNADNATLSVKVDQTVYHKQSKFQDILVFNSKLFGRCLVLDDAIQCTEKDEFSYQEMIAFLPLNCHECPKNVLVIGGGDGGVVREVVKHPLVEKVIQCEIDEEVVEVSKKYLPFMSVGYNNEKLELHIEDGYEYVRQHKNEFDVIITDSSDPKGPATCLFKEPYYKALHESLKSGGIICCQAESYWFDLPLIKDLYSICKSIFTSVSYGTTAVPSYPSGQIGFIICCKDKHINFCSPVHTFTNEQIDRFNLRYYSQQMHSHAFSLPNFVKKELDTL